MPIPSLRLAGCGRLAADHSLAPRFAAAVYLLSIFYLLPDLVSATSSPLEAMLIPSLRLAGYGRFAAGAAGAYRAAPFSGATLLAPADGTLVGMSVSPEFVRCHAIAGGAFTYRRLVGMYPGSRMSTLHGNATITVTVSQRDQRALVVDGVPVDAPNVYFDGRFSVHGVAKPLPCSGLESPARESTQQNRTCRSSSPERSCAATAPAISAVAEHKRRPSRPGNQRRRKEAAAKRRMPHDQTLL